jgi:lipoprotein-anchoring transpeptidase ErfK/SrfK
MRTALALPIVAMLALTGACSSSAPPHSAARPSMTPAAPRVTVVPANGATAVRPDRPVVVTADHGTLTRVVVRSRGHDVAGELSPDHATWKARWTLAPGASYEVTATATGGGRTTTTTTGFRTASARTAIEVGSVVPGNSETAGVGMPIIVTFARPVADTAAVERSFEVHSTYPHEGAWHWVTLNGVQQAVFRLNGYWQAHERVTFTAHLTGVRASAGTYGIHDVTHAFRIGDAHLITVNVRTDQLTVRSNGRIVNTWPVSAGSGNTSGTDPNWLTTSGIHLTMGGFSTVRMTSAWMHVDPKSTQGYDLQVPWAVQISASGEYIHSNQGDDASCLGNRNCSHGCVRSPDAKAHWFEGWAYRGDVVTITGSTRQLAWSNGWGYYQLPWRQWAQGGTVRTAP